MGKNKTEKRDITPELEKFGLLPEYPLTKKEKKLLLVIGENPEADFFFICREMDLKPSKIEKKTAKLMKDGFITVSEDGKIFSLTVSAGKYLEKDKDELKKEKKFKKFLKSLNEEETETFFKICDGFKYENEDGEPETGEND